MKPSLGKGEFVDVQMDDSVTVVTSHKSSDEVPAGTIRLIPCQHNHGVMVEFTLPGAGQCAWRVPLMYRDLYRFGVDQGEDGGD